MRSTRDRSRSQEWLSSHRPQGPSPSRAWCQRSSSRPSVVAQQPSCARSRQRPLPFSAPPICHHVSYQFCRNYRLNIPSNDVLVLPADLVAETADSAVLAAGLESEDSQSLGNNDLLLLVVGRGDTLEDLEALKSGGTTGGLVGDHASDGLVEDSRGGTEVERTCLVSTTILFGSHCNSVDSPPRVGLYRVIFRR